MPPNVLLVVLDAARRDCLEPYGAPAGSTPAIAQLAARGAALPEVRATSCWTVPSHASLFTGLMPRAAGLGRPRTPADARPLVQAQRDRLLPEVLRRAGYSTAATSANLWVSRAAGFDTGFDEFEQVDSGRHERMARRGRGARARWLAEAALGRLDDGADEMGAILGRWTRARRQPFFWFVNLIECHSPYLPPRPQGGLRPIERMRVASDAMRYFTAEQIWRTCGGVTAVPEPALRRARHFYRAAIEYMDSWLAGVLERLDAAGQLDDTLVVVTADHGENFGEGGLITHGLSLDERLIHVPFVAAGPGVDGREIASLAELPRFVAECAGLDDHPWADGPPRGFGVAQFEAPADANDEDAARALAQLGLGGELERFSTSLSCAVRDGLKLLRRGEVEEVYDLVADPGEGRPLRPEELGAGRAAELAALRAALDHPALAARHAGSAAAAAPEASASEVADLEERMRLLGYM